MAAKCISCGVPIESMEESCCEPCNDYNKATRPTDGDYAENLPEVLPRRKVTVCSASLKNPACCNNCDIK